ncbi:alpha-ketoglutarate-dependent dioxygenase AlkB [Thalassotalea ponticola]|uniref:alpha-ketoglutarate-dependent dioxygenase AlkB family protein n=1 Tax=Thalassotalea ponticola TaxID=1523392 RepID=UPI0025B44ED8|nr:alpha-ketoglutarate-dependent dioxygenase AlkB [Thalassotalea ponticola]MDN3652160.1 alpha-ketoglutarate-dependent dioxygenase AlkB [Thalassotalea ponticola]
MSALSQTSDHLTIDSEQKLVSIEPDLSDRLALIDGQLIYYPNFLHRLAPHLFTALEEQLSWHQGQIKLFGKMVTIPRLQAWYGDADAVYRYSQVALQPQPWHWLLSGLKYHCQQVANQRFNSVLANFYRHQQDSMGWHSDNEKELGQQPVIASLSFGCERSFCLRHNITGEKHQLALKSGSLLIMRGALQQQWQHAVPKSRRPMSGRINLTFRFIDAKLTK